MPGQHICSAQWPHSIGAGPTMGAHPSSVPSSPGKGLAALPHPPPLPRGSDGSNNQVRKHRTSPDNVNRAVGHGECCQALIRASCMARPSPWPWSCSPALSLRGPCPSAGREKNLSWLCLSHQQFWDGEEMIRVIPHQQLGESYSLLLDLREFPRGKWCLGFREFCGNLGSSVAHLWFLPTSRARELG